MNSTLRLVVLTRRQSFSIAYMPKSKKSKYYAVSVGRGGPKVYRTWEEVRSSHSFGDLRRSCYIYFSARRKSVLGPTNVLPLYLIPAFKVSRFPGAIHQSFDSQKEAEIWLARKFSISWRMRVCGKALQTPYTPAERYRPQSQDRTMWRAKHTPRTPQPRMSREMALLNRIPIFPWFPHPRYGFLQNRI